MHKELVGRSRCPHWGTPHRSSLFKLQGKDLYVDTLSLLRACSNVLFLHCPSDGLHQVYINGVSVLIGCVFPQLKVSIIQPQGGISSWSFNKLPVRFMLRGATIWGEPTASKLKHFLMPVSPTCPTRRYELTSPRCPEGVRRLLSSLRSGGGNGTRLPSSGSIPIKVKFYLQSDNNAIPARYLLPSSVKS